MTFKRRERLVNEDPQHSWLPAGKQQHRHAGDVHIIKVQTNTLKLVTLKTWDYTKKGIVAIRANTSYSHTEKKPGRVEKYIWANSGQTNPATICIAIKKTIATNKKQAKPQTIKTPNKTNNNKNPTHKTSNKSPEKTKLRLWLKENYRGTTLTLPF